MSFYLWGHIAVSELSPDDLSEWGRYFFCRPRPFRAANSTPKTEVSRKIAILGELSFDVIPKKCLFSSSLVAHFGGRLENTSKPRAVFICLPALVFIALTELFFIDQNSLMFTLLSGFGYIPSHLSLKISFTKCYSFLSSRGGILVPDSVKN
jgi:hypothetical protein